MAFAVHDGSVRPNTDPLSQQRVGEDRRCRHKPRPVQYARYLLLLAGRDPLCMCNGVGDIKRGKCPGNASSCWCRVYSALPWFWMLDQKPERLCSGFPRPYFCPALMAITAVWGMRAALRRHCQIPVGAGRSISPAALRLRG